MKKIVFLAALMTISMGIFAQESPVTWTISQNRVEDGSRNITISAVINENWYIYGMNMEEGGPLPLLISIENQENTVVWAKFKEITPAENVYDEIFSMNVSSYSHNAQFKCNYVPKADIMSLTILIDGQACNKVNGSCVQVLQSIPVTISE
jgi:hypothetical protein